MAHHKSAIKRIRQNKKRKLHNRYYHKTTRNAIRDLKLSEDKKEAAEALPKVVALIDKLAKRNIINKNKASNLKSKLTKKVNSL